MEKVQQTVKRVDVKLAYKHIMARYPKTMAYLASLEQKSRDAN